MLPRPILSLFIASIADQVFADYPYHTIYYRPITIGTYAGLEGIAACPDGCVARIDVIGTNAFSVLASTVFGWTAGPDLLEETDSIVHSIVLTATTALSSTMPGAPL